MNFIDYCILMFASSNKCIASSNKCLTSSNKDASRNIFDACSMPIQPPGPTVHGPIVSHDGFQGSKWTPGVKVTEPCRTVSSTMVHLKTDGERERPI